MDIKTFPSVASAVESLYPGDSILSRSAGGGGGCINSASILVLKSGRFLFMKENAQAPEDMFPCEAEGLSFLKKNYPLEIPRPLALGKEGRNSFLILENIDSGTRSADFWTTFGHSLAEMHLKGRSETYGFHQDNYIGATRQVNTPMARWTDFFVENRLLYQIRLAGKRGLADSHIIGGVEAICRRIEEILPNPDFPSLLHGDLWSGNFMVDSNGQAVLIDPAVYYGHPEADLAMTELFGGFNSEFYRAYEEVNPLEPGYRRRKDLYNLYHMLNHLNLFGSSYEGSVRSIISTYL